MEIGRLPYAAFTYLGSKVLGGMNCLFSATQACGRHTLSGGGTDGTDGTGRHRAALGAPRAARSARSTRSAPGGTWGHRWAPGGTGGAPRVHVGRLWLPTLTAGLSVLPLVS